MSLRGDLNSMNVMLSRDKVSKRWQKSVDMLHTTNSVKPTWERESDARLNVGRVRVKSQSKKRRAKK